MSIQCVMCHSVRPQSELLFAGAGPTCLSCFQPEEVKPEPGSFVGGMSAGLLGGVFGLVAMYVVGARGATKQGAWAGFVVQLAFGLIRLALKLNS